MPPMINSVVKLRHTFRYAASAAVTATNVTANFVFGAIGGICTVANTTVTCWANSFRIRKMTVWAGASTTNDDVDVIFTDTSTDYFEDREMLVDIPAGITVERALVFTPPKTSICNFWVASSLATNTVMTLTVGSGSIVDMDVEFTLGSGNLTNKTQTVATGVLGTTYYLALDGTTNHKLVPRGVQTTF